MPSDLTEPAEHETVKKLDVNANEQRLIWIRTAGRKNTCTIPFDHC